MYGYIEILSPLYDWPISLLEPYMTEDSMIDSWLFTYFHEEFFVLSGFGTGLLYGFFAFILFLLTFAGSKQR